MAILPPASSTLAIVPVMLCCAEAAEQESRASAAAAKISFAVFMFGSRHCNACDKRRASPLVPASNMKGTDTRFREVCRLQIGVVFHAREIARALHSI